MADELIDVINEKDKVIGQEWKSKCHKEGLLHRVGAVFIFNDKGQLLLQKRAAKKSLGKNLYDYSASGHIGLGEGYEIEARKELNEELGINAPITRFPGEIKIESFVYQIDMMIRHKIVLFVGYHNGPFNIQEEELDSVEFFDLKRIEEMILENPDKFTEGFKIGFKTYMERK